MYSQCVNGRLWGAERFQHAVSYICLTSISISCKYIMYSLCIQFFTNTTYKNLYSTPHPIHTVLSSFGLYILYSVLFVYTYCTQYIWYIHTVLSTFGLMDYILYSVLVVYTYCTQYSLSIHTVFSSFGLYILYSVLLVYTYSTQCFWSIHTLLTVLSTFGLYILYWVQYVYFWSIHTVLSAFGLYIYCT